MEFDKEPEDSREQAQDKMAEINKIFAQAKAPAKKEKPVRVADMQQVLKATNMDHITQR